MPKNGNTIITTIFKRKVLDCENESEYFRLVDPERGQYTQTNKDKKWSILYETLCNGYSPITGKSGTNVYELMEWTGIKRATLYNIAKRVPKTKENYVRLACYFGIGLDKANKLLTRYGGFAKLNPDSTDLEELTYMNCIKVTSESPRLFKTRVFNWEEESGEKYKTDFYNITDYETLKKLCEVKKITYRADRNHDVFADKIGVYIKKCGYKSARYFLSNTLFYNGSPKCYNSLYKASTYNEAKGIRKNSTLTRRAVITLALLLGLPLKDIDKLLSAANMEGLCAKNPFESAIIFVLNDLYKKSGYEDLGNSSVMCSERNKELQQKLKDGSVFGYVYHRLHSERFKKVFEDEEIDIDHELMYSER